MPESWDGYPYVIHSSALIDMARSVYVTANNYKDDKWIIYKLDDEGQRIWEHEEPGRIVANPTLNEDKLFTALGDGHFIAIGLESGQRLWKSKVCEQIVNDFGAMSATDGMVVGGCGYAPGPNRVVAVSARDGSLSWQFTPDTHPYNFLGPVLDGFLVFSDHVGRAYKLEIKTGKEVWRSANTTGDTPTSIGSGGAVIGQNRVVYVTSNDGTDQDGKGNLKAIDFNNGNLIWERITDLPANSAPAVGHLRPGGTGPLAVVIATGPNPGGWSDEEQRLTYNGGIGPKRGDVYAFNAKSGTLLWSYTPAPSAQTWAAGDTGSRTCWPDSFSNPTISGDGMVLTTFMNGKLFSIQDQNKDGTIQASEVTGFDMGAAAQGPASFAPFMMVAAACDGIHVFKPNPDMPKRNVQLLQ